MSTYIGNNEISGIYVGNSEISSIYVGTDLVYSGSTPPTPTGDTTNYLCFTAQQDNSSVALSTHGTPSTITLEYSLDKQTWNTWDLSTITINSGDKMYLRGDNNTVGSASNNYYTFTMSGVIVADGSTMTLMDKTDTLRSVPSYAFYGLFSGCTSLTTAPELPATAITTYCYYYMFYGCTNLTKAPSELPATALVNYCYNGMFNGCTSLTTAPILRFKTTAQNGAVAMFSGCTNLNEVTCYKTGTLTRGTMNNWLAGVSATGTLYNNGGANWGTSSVANGGIPSGWTKITP